jgi:choice-of-anchor B domain-containing protein
MAFRAAPALALFTVLTAAAPAMAMQSPPNLNTAKLSQLDTQSNYNDVWGYQAPDGREYACVGTSSGVMIANCTDPLDAYEVGFFPGAFCTWRDLKTFNEYLYVVNDCSGGVDVLDMSDPENPVQVNTFGAEYMNHAHNVAIDTDAGILYAAGTQNGMHVFDLNVDPVSPPRIDRWGGPYVHDVSVQDDVAHAALIYNGQYRVLDVSNPSNVSTMTNVPSGANFTHATWPNADNTVVVAADEKSALRHLTFFDTTNVLNPLVASRYTENSLSIPHNPFIKDDVCHVSWYTEGYIALDISDPYNPVKLGRFDTQPGTPAGGISGFDGAWGCYPFSPSGAIYISDRQRGLFVVSLNECSAGLPNLPQPQVCRVWPDSVSALDSPRQRVMLTGKGFTSATQVSVGGAILGSNDFTRLGDQVIHFRMPLVSSVGFNNITVSNGAGTSLPIQVEVTLPSGPTIDAGEVDQEVGSNFLVAFGSQPGDFFYPVASLSPLPSSVFEVNFDIGNSFSELIWLPSKVANMAGVNGFPVVVPPSALGLTVYWQVAVVDPLQGVPAMVTSVASTTVIDND